MTYRIIATSILALGLLSPVAFAGERYVGSGGGETCGFNQTVNSATASCDDETNTSMVKTSPLAATSSTSMWHGADFIGDTSDSRIDRFAN